MNFDPAIASQEALARAYAEDVLGDAKPDIEKAEDVFSSETGVEAERAYETLIAIGETLPQATAFQEFLIFITWQHAMENPMPRYFHKGTQLTEQFLARFGSQLQETDIYERIVTIQRSFKRGLGKNVESIQDEYDRDAFHGGD